MSLSLRLLGMIVSDFVISERSIIERGGTGVHGPCIGDFVLLWGMCIALEKKGNRRWNEYIQRQTFIS